MPSPRSLPAPLPTAGAPSTETTDAAFLSDICARPRGDVRSVREGLILGARLAIASRYSTRDP